MLGGRSQIKQTGKPKGLREPLGGVGHVCYLDGGDVITGVCISPASNCMH